MAKAGRKRKTGVKREANGRVARLKRKAAEEGIMSVAIKARARIHGLKPAECKDQMAECFVGRLCIGRELTPQQYEAAKQFLADYRANAAAIQAPRDTSAMDFNRVPGGALRAEDVEANRRATQKWKAAVEAVQSRQNELRGEGALYAALQYCVLQDLQAVHMVGWLREGLNALVRHYRITERARVA